MERVSRRRLLAAGSGAALASGVIGSGVAAAQGTRPPGQPLTSWLERYIIAMDPAAAKSARPAPQAGTAPTGPGYLEGTVYLDGDVSADGTVAAGKGPVGRFRVGAWIATGGTLPTGIGIATLDIFGRGKISLAGAGGFVGSYGVSGGTGEFSFVSGEVRLALMSPGSAARVIAEVDLQSQTSGR